MTSVQNIADVKLYLLSGRQWKRDHRIAHARWKLACARQAKNGPEEAFYCAVLDALGDTSATEGWDDWPVSS